MTESPNSSDVCPTTISNTSERDTLNSSHNLQVKSSVINHQKDVEIDSAFHSNCKFCVKETSSRKNIGLNLVIMNKYVIGVKNSVFLLILTAVGMAANWIFWPVTNGSFFGKWVYLGGTVFFVGLFVYFFL